MEVGLGPGRLCVRWGHRYPPKKILGPCLLWPNGWTDQDNTCQGGRPHPRRPCSVRWGPSPLPKKGAEPLPKFLAHFCCGQTAGCTKIPLCMELGLSPGDFVLDGDPAPEQKGGRAPQIFGPCLFWPNGWMHQNGTWHGGRPQPRRLCVRWGPSPPP